MLEGLGWIPTIVGIGVRTLAYRLILTMHGAAAIEKGVRIRFAEQRRARCTARISIKASICTRVRTAFTSGGNSLVMHGSVLHVYNFRDIPHSGIWIGDDSLIGEYNVIRGQGGVHIGDRVYTSPMVQLLAVNHVFDDPGRPFVEQGITAQGITIEDDVWIGSGAIVTDGVTIGKGARGRGRIGRHRATCRPATVVVAGSPARESSDESRQTSARTRT